jgi:hypothetical protein
LLELSRYVHLNPVRLASYKGREEREKIKDVERFPWSSLAGYLSSSEKQFWATYDTVLGYVGGSRKKYREFYHRRHPSGIRDPVGRSQRPDDIGRRGFRGTDQGEIEKAAIEERTTFGQTTGGMDPRAVLKKVARYFQVPESHLTAKRTGRRDERGMALELIYRYCGASQARIGELVGLDYTAVSRERKRLPRPQRSR